MDEIVRFYEQNLQGVWGKPVGASDIEIDSAQRMLGVQLPMRYRHFLKWMGRDYAGVLRGSNWFIDQLSENREILTNFFIEAGSSHILPKDTVVFHSHGGYAAAYFVCEAGVDDPDVFVVVEAMRLGSGSKIKH